MTFTQNIPVITIDGPSGSGKGTISRLVSKALGWNFLDSGALYRVLAESVMEHGVDITNEKIVSDLAETLQVDFKEEQIILEGRFVTQTIRSELCGSVASQIAAYPKVREALLGRQRAFLQPPGLVADGRDMGTVVFPNANLKIYLDASVEERAKRRFLQLKEELKDENQNVTLQSLLVEIKDRDTRDKQRVVSPLLPAKDAVIIDTTAMGIEAVFETVMGIVNTSIKGKP